MTLKRAADHVGYGLGEIKREMQDDAIFKVEVRQAMADPELALLAQLMESKQWQAWKFLLQSLYPRRYYAANKRKSRPRKHAKSRRELLAPVSDAELRVLEPILKKIEDAQRSGSTDTNELVRCEGGIGRAEPG